MSDIFTLKTIPLTPDIGMTLKNFRIENKVTAKSITEKYNKAASYISKLENGDIKKIDSNFLIDLCNYISGNKDGFKLFLNKLSQNYRDFSNESKIILTNIDDLVYEHTVPSNLIDNMRQYISKHNLSIPQIADVINSNSDISDIPDYSKHPKNIWYDKDNNIDNITIKLDVPSSYIEDLLNGKTTTVHRIIMEAILYSMYKCGGEKNSRDVAFNELKAYHILPRRSVTIVTPNEIAELFNGLEPDTTDAFKEIVTGLKVITVVTKDYGKRKIKQIRNNLSVDPGFSFAYMSIDITKLEKKDKDKKTEFLKELKSLVEKYSKDDESNNIDLYE